MQIIVCFSGKKQSGKNTSANFLAGSWLKKYGYISRFYITTNGLLGFQMNGHEEQIPEGEFNEYFKDLPIKIYSFADPLKEFCINVLGLTYEQCYGSDSDKNTLTKIKYKSLPTYRESQDKVREKLGYPPHDEFLTARELMQYFGTDIVREMYSDAWVLGTINKIRQDKVQLAIITDGRFPNEIEGIKNVGGYTVRLLRNVAKDDEHKSEKALDDYPLDKYSFVLDNRNLTVQEQCEKIRPFTEIVLEKMGNV